MVYRGGPTLPYYTVSNAYIVMKMLNGYIVTPKQDHFYNLGK